MRRQQSGFTIIELMVATTAFSVILLILTASVIQIGKMYYKGIISSRTQEKSRTIIDSVTRPIQFAQGDVYRSSQSTPSAAAPAIGAICIEGVRYTYALNAQVDDTVPGYNQSNHKYKHALWQDVMSGFNCLPVDLNNPPAGGRELLAAGERLTKFEIEPVGGFTNLWRVTIGVLYGDDDLINFNSGQPVNCKSGVSGSQWCALSELSTQIVKRIQ